MGDLPLLQDVLVQVLGEDPSALSSILHLKGLGVFTPGKMETHDKLNSEEVVCDGSLQKGICIDGFVFMFLSSTYGS